MPPQKSLPFLLFILLFFVLSACSDKKTSSEDDLLATVQALQTQVGATTVGTPNPPGSQDGDPAHPTPAPSLTDQATPAGDQVGQWNQFPLLGQLGGSSYAVTAQGDLAYLGVGPRLVVLDISQPDNPTQIGQSGVFPGIVHDVGVQGDYAYVVTGILGGLHIIDIRDPRAPRQVSYLDTPPTGCNALVLADSLAYLGCNPYGLRIVDISDPQAPQELGSLQLKQAIIDLALDGNTAALVAAGEGMYLVDVSNPSNPSQVGYFPEPERLTETQMDSVQFMTIAASGGYAYLSAGVAGMAVVDIHNPQDPQLAGSFNANVTNGIAVNGNTAYLVDEFDGVYLLDISDPANPTQLGLVPAEMGTENELNVVTYMARGVAVENGRLFVSDAWHSLYILDVADPASPVRLAHFQAPATDRLVDVVLADNIAYLIGDSSGLRIVDVSDPANMRELAYDDRRIRVTLQVPTAIEWADNHVYITDVNIGFHIYDVSNPSQPVEVGLIQELGFVEDLYLRGDYAYLATQDWQNDNIPRLLVVDVRDPSNPQVVNRVDIPLEKDHISWSMSGEGQQLYLVDFSFGAVSQVFYIFDLSDPANPTLAAQPPLTLPSANGGCILVQDQSAYISNLFPPLQMYDLQDPLAPQLAGQVAEIGMGFDLEKIGSVLLGLPNSLAGYDISNLRQPAMLGLSYLPANPFGLDVAGDLAYVVGLDFGLMVFQWR